MAWHSALEHVACQGVEYAAAVVLDWRRLRYRRRRRTQNFAQARTWYEKAAAQGHAPAQAKLAALRGPTVVATMQPLQVRTDG